MRRATVLLLWAGAAHMEGDELIFVDPFKTLISGDIVLNKVGLFIYSKGGSAASWIAAVDEAAKLGVEHVLPDHSPIGDGSLITRERAFLSELRDRALVLKGQEEDTAHAGDQLTAEFKTAYPDWQIGDLTSFVKAAYAEVSSTQLSHARYDRRTYPMERSV